MIAFPKSCSRLAQALRDRLHKSPFVAIRKLDCDVQGPVVTLRGRVPTFYTKQIALHLAFSTPAVLRVVDEIEVGD